MSSSEGLPSKPIAISQPQFGEEEMALVRQALLSGVVAQGPIVAEFEREFAKLVGANHAVAVASGTAALHLAVLAHGIGPGDEVITTPFTFIASANCVLYAGATPRFVDICPDTFNIDPDQVARAITPRTKAIMPVHLYGLMADMGPIMDLAREHGLAVIEDAAQAHGATYHGRVAGSFGTGCFSFYATKNITSAEGGMVTTNDPEIADRLRLLRSHGMRVRYYHDVLGFNQRMSEIHAAIGLAQLRKLGVFNEQRKSNAAYLSANLKGVVTPVEPAGFGHVWHQYTIRLPGRDRDLAASQLAHKNIGTGIFYPVPVHRQKLYLDLALTASCPVAEEWSTQVLSLPVHPSLDDSDLQSIVRAVNAL
jgi:dTDP-4-amino-4,6-dideoxygalactose transaminase